MHFKLGVFAGICASTGVCLNGIIIALRLIPSQECSLSTANQKSLYDPRILTSTAGYPRNALQTTVQGLKYHLIATCSSKAANILLQLPRRMIWVVGKIYLLGEYQGFTQVGSLELDRAVPLEEYASDALV